MSEKNYDFNERSEKIVRTLATIFDYLALNGNFQVEDCENYIQVKITSDDAGRVIGRHGQTLSSLQLLINRMMFKDNENTPEIRLDMDGYASGNREERGAAPRSGENGESGREPRRRSRGGRRGHGGEPRSTATQEQLEQQAKDAAKEVKRWGEPVRLPEMNAHDRRIIHVTLQDDPEIVTESEGEGAMKKVVISLKKEAE